MLLETLLLKIKTREDCPPLEGWATDWVIYKSSMNKCF